MNHFLFSASLPDGNEVCIAPVSYDAFRDNDIDTLGDDAGYFIYEYDPRRSEAGIEILAKAASYDAAMRIMDIFLSSRIKPPHTEVRSTSSSNDQSRLDMPASIAGETRKLRCTRTKL